MKKYKVIPFLARRQGLACLDALFNDERFRPEMVFTHKYDFADEKGDRKIRDEYPLFEERAAKFGLQLHTLKKGEAFEMLAQENYDFLVSVSCAFVFPKDILEKSRIEALNIHPSIADNHELRYKGGTTSSCIERALANGDKEIGVSIHRMSEEVDRGYVLKCKTIGIEAGDGLWDVYRKIIPVYPSALMETLNELVSRRGF